MQIAENSGETAQKHESHAFSTLQGSGGSVKVRMFFILIMKFFFGPKVRTDSTTKVNWDKTIPNIN